MSSFDNKDLFSSGPHRFAVGGLALRHAVQENPGLRGVQVAGLGTSGRTIVQTGTLLADDLARMREQIAAIEACVDGRACELVDDRGQIWSDTVMLRFEPQATTRLGPRVRTGYRIQYLQTAP